MFIRIKKINTQEYAYLVENYWINNSSRQRVKEYLGKIVKPERTEFDSNLDFNSNYTTIINKLFERELLRHGFKEANVLQGRTLELGRIKANLESLDVVKGKKNVLLAINEGFLSKKTIQELINFKALEDKQKTGIKLAQAILEAGLKVSDEEFVKLFEKIPFKEEKQEFNKEEFYY